MFDIIGRRHLYFLLSALILVPGTIALLIWGLRPGIDFTGGSVLEVRVGPYEKKEEAEKVKSQLEAAGQETALVRVQR